MKVVFGTCTDITSFPSTVTRMLGAPPHWSPRARTDSRVEAGTESVLVMAALRTNSTSRPPLASARATDRALPVEEMPLIDSASNAAAAGGGGGGGGGGSSLSGEKVSLSTRRLRSQPVPPSLVNETEIERVPAAMSTGAV